MSGATRIIPAAAGTHGFDASEKLTPATAKALKQAGFTFALRYLSRKAVPPPGDLTAAEVELILDSGLALMAVQHVAKSGWSPTEDLGSEYGRNAATQARSVGLPAGTSVWLDLEEASSKATADDIVAYCNAWFKEVQSAGYVTGVYVGSNAHLTGEQLYLRLKTQHYWKSGSHVPDIPHRGYCMVQHILPGDAVGGVEICRDVTFVDAFGSTPMMAVRSAPSPVLSENTALSFAVSTDEEATLRSLAAQNGLTEPMETLLAFRNKRGAPKSARYWAIANFNLRSSEPRLFVFDVKNKFVQPYLCAHGKGSEGPTDDGYANVFSNEPGSNCTSLGVYRGAEPYEGKHGHSLRLDGLEATNSNARGRDVVMHGADYVSPQFVLNTGRIGRSDGCLALENRYITEVVDQLSGGSLILAWHKDAGTTISASDGDEQWSEMEPPSGVTTSPQTAPPAPTAAMLAQRILDSERIVLARVHVSGMDNATAYLNLVDTAAGRPASRSSYGNAPGGTVNLDPTMLASLLMLAETYSFSVSEFCGGSHSLNSRHYAGRTADFNTINGRHITPTHPDVVAFQARCRALGATQVLGPGVKDHDTHVHASWPAP